MELRDIEIFLVLAEELHFGRTAARLHVSQARVSQAIKKQERRIGAPLFERTSRRVSLTPVGQRLRADLRQAYDLIQLGLARAMSTQGVGGVLRLGVMGALGNEMRPVIETFQHLYPECEVTTSEFHFSDPFAAVRSGQVDLQLMWLPVREPDLEVGPPVLTESRVLAVPADSELSAHKAVSMEDLADHVTPSLGPIIPDYWAEAMLPQATPLGRPVRRGPETRTFHEILALVAAGKVVCPLNAHVAWYYSHPGVAFVPIQDAPITEWALVWPARATSPALHAFIDIAHRQGARAITPPSTGADVD